MMSMYWNVPSKFVLLPTEFKFFSITDLYGAVKCVPQRSEFFKLGTILSFTQTF